jgi:hypothetical protein
VSTLPAGRLEVGEQGVPTGSDEYVQFVDDMKYAVVDPLLWYQTAEVLLVPSAFVSWAGSGASAVCAPANHMPPAQTATAKVTAHVSRIRLVVIRCSRSRLDRAASR